MRSTPELIHGYRLADMRKIVKTKKLSENEIDELVVSQSEDRSAWTKPFRVQRSKHPSISIPADVASRAAFFSRLHRAPNMDEWIKKVIRERLEMEEAVYTQVKRELAK